jgi:hypothetical protein
MDTARDLKLTYEHLGKELLTRVIIPYPCIEKRLLQRREERVRRRKGREGWEYWNLETPIVKLWLRLCFNLRKAVYVSRCSDTSV